MCVCVCKRERDRERRTDRVTDRQRQREINYIFLSITIGFLSPNSTYSLNPQFTLSPPLTFSPISSPPPPITYYRCKCKADSALMFSCLRKESFSGHWPMRT